MRVLPLIALLAASGLVPGVARAQEENPESVRGLKIVIPEARGKRSWGRAKLSRTLRRTMSAAVGPLIKSRDLTKAQRKLKLRGRKKRSPEGLAKAARVVGAQYILDVTLSKKKWLYTARALLINAETGEVQMDFRSQFYKPSKEAADRGERVGRRTIQKLAELMNSGRAPAVGVATAPPPAAPPPEAPPRSPPVDDPGSDLREDPDPTAAAPVSEPPPPVIASAPPPSAPPAAPPPAVASAPPPTSSSFNSGSNSASTTLEPAPEDASEILRLSLGAGAGLLRTYDLASGGGGNSRLSHQLEPLSLIDVRAEFIAPQVPVSIGLNGAFRPVKYNIDVADAGIVTPSGTVLDLALNAGYHIGIAGSGRSTYKIIPVVGGRFSSSMVKEHPGNAVLSSTTIAAIAGLGMRLPFNDVLEVDFGVDGGLILSYSENPLNSGDGGSGFTVGGDVGARIWVSDIIAIAIDNRFTYDSITLSGTPSRQLPGGESPDLQDATITWKDLRTSAGIAVRL